MSILKQLETDLKNIVKQAGYDTEKLALEASNRRDLGEYQLNDAMQLARTYKQNPREIASKIVEELEKDDRFEKINIAGPGFINFSLSEKYTIDFMNKVNNDIYANIDKKDNKTVVIDFGGANVAKALHVGHLRSANIGEALKRLGRALGYTVYGDAHLGDYGRPLGLVILEIRTRYPELPYFDENYTGDFSEIELPITNKDLEIIYPLASQKSKEDESYLEEARKITVRIQKHERGYYDLWKKIVEISKEDIKAVYDALNVEYDLWLGESDAAEYFPQLNQIYEEKGLLKESDGAKIIEVVEEDDKAPMPPLLFVKSNGSISYETTDLATILQRKIELNPDEIWYCVDNRQELRFEQIFRAARKANLVDDNVKLEHIGFGTMNGRDGKPFKTRDGGVMTLKSLINLVQEETYKKITNDSIKEEEKLDIANTVAIAALKYADLLPYRGTDYIFEIEKFADLEGKTGPYLLYSTIRMKSLLAKAAQIDAKEIKTLKGETEKDIALTVLNLPLVLDKSLETKSLNEITEYLYKLTSIYNKFYAENKILIEEDNDKKESWLVLTKIVYSINTMLLDILGINIPTKM
jgi:arginyl-tRNA synthetase